MTTDMTLSVEQIIEYYGARWKIESGFKEIKQEIGSSKSQVRNADSVLNHFNFCMMATTLTWLYADRLQNAPDRRHKIRGRAGFAFSDVSRIIAEEALSPDFCQDIVTHGGRSKMDYKFSGNFSLFIDFEYKWLDKKMQIKKSLRAITL